jgi:hypothetical protein
MKPDKQTSGMNYLLKAVILAVVVLLVLVSAMSGCGGTKKVSATDQLSDQYKKSESVTMNSGTTENEKNSPTLERKVTREVSLEIIVSDVGEVASRLEEMVKSTGGYVQNASMRQINGLMQSNMTLRVPAEKLDDLLPRIEVLGKLERKNITGKDVTEEYYDSSARKATLEKQEKRILELLDKADTVKEILEIENELARVRGQIESLQARLKVIDDLTSLATVNVELRAPKSISTGETMKEPLGQRIKAAWLRGVNGITDAVEGLVVLAVTLIPYSPVIVLAGYGLYRVWKKKNNKS